MYAGYSVPNQWGHQSAMQQGYMFTPPSYAQHNAAGADAAAASPPPGYAQPPFPPSAGDDKSSQ